MMAKDETSLIFILITLLDVAYSILLTGSNFTKFPGETIAVICKDEGGRLVMWQGPKGPLSSHTRPSVMETAAGKMLVFQDTRISDTGNYTCCLIANQKDKKVFTLIVEEPIDFRDTPIIQRGVEGQDMALRCEVSGSSSISWIMPNNLTNSRYKIIGDGLVIRNVTRSDTDQVFLCEASQRSTGELKRRNITLVVEHPPIPEEDAETGELYAQDEEMYGIIGETVNLTCEVRAEPPPKFEWYRKLHGKTDYKNILHESFLQLTMTKHTEGEYLCVASNTHGKLKKTVNLLIGKRPETPGNITLQNNTMDSLILNVDLPEVSEDDFDDGMQPTWLIIQYRKESTVEWKTLDLYLNITEDESYPIDDASSTNSTSRVETFTLSDLESKTKYEVIAATKNIASISDFTDPVFFETLSSGVLHKELSYGILVLVLITFAMA